MQMKLKQLFDQWGRKAHEEYAVKQWLLSKWDVNEGIEWPEEKTEMLLRTIKEGLQPQAQDLLLDLGCGGGWILERLATCVKRAYGLDFSMEMLKFADAPLKNGRLVCAEIGRIPLVDGQFDRILSYYVFMNFDDDKYVERSLMEIYRVLKKGGRALIGQLPDVNGSLKYERAKEAHICYCKEAFKMGRSIREEFRPPLRLFDRVKLGSFLDARGISHSFQDSFDPFFHHGKPGTVDWRFDLIIKS